jgi:hypothetical protein
MTHHANGAATKNAISTSLTKSFDSRTMMLLTEDPNTLRMPISLTLVFIVNKASANKPRQEITIAILVPLITILENVFSL